MSTCPDTAECNRSGCKRCADGPSQAERDMQAFLANARELHEGIERPLRTARRWAVFWFVCWVLSIASRILQ